MARLLTPEQDAIVEADSLKEDIEAAEMMDTLSQNGVFFNGKRQILRDPLARLLECPAYVADVTKPWGVDHAGRVMDIYFSREYPQKRIIVDDLTEERPEEYFIERRKLCARFGYIYLYSSPSRELNKESLDKQIEASCVVMRSLLPTKEVKSAAPSQEHRESEKPSEVVAPAQPALVRPQSAGNNANRSNRR